LTFVNRCRWRARRLAACKLRPFRHCPRASCPRARRKAPRPSTCARNGRPSAARAGRAGCWESYLAIEGIYCAGCSLSIEQALTGLPGVADVEVNGATATARIVWTPSQGRPSQWLHALQRAGYRGLPAATSSAAVPRRQAQRLLLWRWLVAGFCMMQVMMYAVPAYVADPAR
jgi:Cu2+-exporting ATPase